MWNIMNEDQQNLEIEKIIFSDDEFSDFLFGLISDL